ncbi:T9SS type A sorting domain-containing protein [Pedobacter sp. SD-b]|uniref:T9SS type A sorting domain-containing protein n=1 Tax=Pedobacter segetis TaxID=2793069 RepID=A0ABS1BM42_9SPHI|nr:T9SS type A sorting domain-containing protein [Pedobacter segetis]MBK0383926.1 T9SS type A sorting domain-containing protein [Pedobacter segetis]
MKKILLLSFLSVFYFSSKAQLIYNFNAANGSPTSGVPTGFSASDVTANNTAKTSDFFTTVSASSGYNGASGNGNITTAAKGGNSATDISGLSYFEFTITPSSTERVKISSISFGSKSIGSSGGPTSYIIRTSLDNYNANVALVNINSNSAWTLYNNQFSLPLIGATNTPITIRIYGDNGTGAVGQTNNWRIDDLNVNFVSRPAISNYLMGQNAWLPKGTFGGTTYNGQLNVLWPTIKASGVKMIRIGGSWAEGAMLPGDKVVDLIDSIRKIGAEPMVQVATNRGNISATQAANLVEYVNTTSGRNVKYWIIGNEPDIGSTTANVSTVATYIKSFSSAMKAKDPNILIVGPECAYYNSNYYPSLIGGANDITGKDANGNYYIDVVSFHTYPFGGTQTRAQVVANGQNLGNNVDNLIGLMNNANILNNRTGSNQLKWAITEFNVDYINPSSNTVAGVGVHSFLNGQFWADAFNVGMTRGALTITPWSVQEGGGARGTGDLGYMDGSGATLKPRSSYYHEKMIAENINGNYIQSSNNQSLVTTMGAIRNDTVSVMLVNKSDVTNYSYALQLSEQPVTDPATLKINLLADINVLYKDNIDAQTTIVLVFNKTGDLLKKIVYGITQATNQVAPVQTNYTLPLNWINFSAQKQSNGSVLLNWLVNNLVNTQSFEIEKLVGNNFIKIGTKPSVDGAGNQLYNFIDKNPSSGINYYRIKQLDNNGDFTYSNVVSVKLLNNVHDWEVYPNPITDENPLFHLKINQDAKSLIFKLYSSSAQMLIEKSFKDVKEGNDFNINNQILKAGIYILEVNTEGNKRTEKLIVR